MSGDTKEGSKDTMSSSSNKEDAGGVAPAEWVVWQLVDSMLPAGGFAHSQVRRARVNSPVRNWWVPREARRLRSFQASYSYSQLHRIRY